MQWRAISKLHGTYDYATGDTRAPVIVLMPQEMQDHGHSNLLYATVDTRAGPWCSFIRRKRCKCRVTLLISMPQEMQEEDHLQIHELYSGRQKYSARSAKVAHLLRAITTVLNKIERSSFLFERPWRPLYIQLITVKQL
jgi:hypothetical protein